MNLSLILAAAWFIIANVIALIPSKRKHWPQAYVLIVVGVPIFGFVTFQNGPWIGLLVLAGGQYPALACVLSLALAEGEVLTTVSILPRFFARNAYEGHDKRRGLG